MRSARRCEPTGVPFRRPAHTAGQALILVLMMLPVLSWLSWDMLSRAAQQAAHGAAHAGLGALQAAALRNLTAALAEARGGGLRAGVARTESNGVTVTRAVARLAPGKSAPDARALTGFVITARARSEDGEVALRLAFVFPDDGSPANGVWHVSAP